MTNKPLQIGKIYYFNHYTIGYIQQNPPYLTSYKTATSSDPIFMLLALEEEKTIYTGILFNVGDRNYKCIKYTIKLLCEDGLTATLITREKPELAFSLVE